MRKFPLVVVLLMLALAGCSKTATAPPKTHAATTTTACTPFNGVLAAENPKPGDAGNPHTCPQRATTTTTTPPTSQAHNQGPIGPTSGDVEYICTNATAGPGTADTAAIDAVTDGSGNWTCPTSEFTQLAEIQVGGSFFCTATVHDPDNESWTYGPYPALIGNFNVSGVAGTYYGAYCMAPTSSTYESEAAEAGSSTTYLLTTTS